MLLSKLPDELKDEFSGLLREEGSEDEKRIVRTADKLSALIKCVTEEKNGNKEYKKAREATEATLKKLQSPELDYFMKTFLPSFEITLDDM